jgi:hypothetical protein
VSASAHATAAGTGLPVSSSLRLSPISLKKLTHGVVPADAEPEHEPPDHQPDRERKSAHGRSRRGLPDRGGDHDDEREQVHRLAALLVAEVAFVFVFVVVVVWIGRLTENEREKGSERGEEREGREEERKGERKKKTLSTSLPFHAPKDHLARQSADERDTGDGQVDVGGKLAAVFGEVDDADRGFGQADDEEVVRVGEEPDAGDEDGLFWFWFWFDFGLFFASGGGGVEVERERVEIGRRGRRRRKQLKSFSLRSRSKRTGEVIETSSSSSHCFPLLRRVLRQSPAPFFSR